MYIELIGERVLSVCLALRAHCTFDGDGGSKLQSRSCLSCVFGTRDLFNISYSRELYLFSKFLHFEEIVVLKWLFALK